jgi:hypothetical protein
MKIQALGYDPEADELDLLIDTDAPQPAEAVPVDAGVYIRRDLETGRVVGSMIRGYANFLRTVLTERAISPAEAVKVGLDKEFAAIVDWQRKALRLSRDLLTHLGTDSGKEQQALLETLLAQAG